MGSHPGLLFGISGLSSYRDGPSMDRGSGGAFGDDMMAADGFSSASWISQNFTKQRINRHAAKKLVVAGDRPRHVDGAASVGLGYPSAVAESEQSSKREPRNEARLESMGLGRGDCVTAASAANELAARL
jgi:hypothetical protein